MKQKVNIIEGRDEVERKEGMMQWFYEREG